MKLSPVQVASHALLGGALGDSIGLPYEGLRARRIGKISPGPLRQKLCLGRGMLSDDTEHGCMTLLCLKESHGNVEVFRRLLAWRLRWWFAAIPAGVGLATARSMIKLWLGARPQSSGVFSAGNGPLMRSVIIGAWFADAPKERRGFVEASTVMTHSDPIALQVADWIAGAASMAARGDRTTDGIMMHLLAQAEGAELKVRLEKFKLSLEAGDDVCVFADSFSRKQGFVSGYAPDTAVVAVYAWLRHRGDFRSIIESVVKAGGDTDTVAYVAGCLAAADGCELPEEWMETIRDWPLNLRQIRKLSSENGAVYPIWPICLLRNALFLVVVLCHGFRRLFPPY